MEFFIRQGATDPILKLGLIDDGKNDKSSFNDLLENATITFDMIDVRTEMYHLMNETCQIRLRTKKYDQTTDEYYIAYRFTEFGTSIKGRYEGIITVQFYDEGLNPVHKLICPISEKLYINVI